MRKAGGLIALIAGIFGVIAAFATLMIGGMGSALEAQNAQVVVNLGWGGVAFSFLTIVLGAVAMSARSRWPGVLLVLSALAGAVLGGTLVAIFMALALIGGILATIGNPPVPASLAAMVLAVAAVWGCGETLAQGKTIDIIDFLVDRDDLVGQTLTVSGCKFGAATDSQVLCAAAGGQGSVAIESKSLFKEDLRRALKQCSAFSAMAPADCSGNVTGFLSKGPFGFRLTKATIGWRPSS